MRNAKYQNDFEALQLLFNHYSLRGAGLPDLLRKGQDLELPFEESDFVQAWKQGKLYVSHVYRTEDGYIPHATSSWTDRFLQGYFGYTEALGAFQISDTIPNPVVPTLETTISTGSPIVCVTVAPDRQQFAIGSLNGSITICDISSGSVIRVIRECHSRAWTLSFSPTGEFLFSGHQNGDLYQWDREGKLIGKFETKDWVRSISCSPDGKHLLTSHKVSEPDCALVRGWKASPLENISSYIHLSGTVWSIRNLLDGSGFVSGGHDRKVTLWSYNRSGVVWSEKKHTGTITCLSLHPAGGVVASGAWTGTIKLWDLETGQDLRTIEAHSSRIYGLDFSPSGAILASGGKDSQVTLSAMPNGGTISQFHAHSGWIRGLQFIDETTLVSCGSEGTCKVWRLKHRFPVTTHTVVYATSKEVLDEFRRPVDEDDD